MRPFLHDANRLIRVLLRGAAVYVTVGLATAALISSIAVGPFAVFVLYDGALGAAASGILQAAWLQWERSRWTSARKLTRFGSLTGAVLGLFNFAPAFTHSTDVIHSWRTIWIFAIAGVAGGYVAGRSHARYFIRDVRLHTAAGDRRRVVTACAIFIPLALAEYAYYGPTLSRHFPVFALRERSVVGLPCGPATGEQWSGSYDYNAQFLPSSGIVGSEGGLVQFRQDGGCVTVTGFTDTTLRGGIDATGRFWAGGQESGLSEDGTLRVLVNGQFRDANEFSCSIRVSVLSGTTIINTTRADGVGHRWPGGR